MSPVRRMSPLGLGTVIELPVEPRSCLLWELGEDAARESVQHGDPGFEKEAWLSSLLLTWGHAGRVAHVDDELVGFVATAPPRFSPRSTTLPTSPVAADAVLLLTGWVDPRHVGTGIARMLVQGVAKDLTQRGVRALEAFALAEGAVGECLLPLAFYEAVGFTVVREHPEVPRVRLELRSALAWREDVEVALDQLLGSLAVSLRS